MDPRLLRGTSGGGTPDERLQRVAGPLTAPAIPQVALARPHPTPRHPVSLTQRARR